MVFTPFCLLLAPWQAMAAAGTRGSGCAPSQASAVAEGPPYTWDMIKGKLERTPLPWPRARHNDALIFFRYIGETEPGVPDDWRGIDIPLAGDTVDIGTVTYDSKGPGFEVSLTPKQPWSWRAFLTQMKDPIGDVVDQHGGVLSIRCAPIPNTCDPYPRQRPLSRTRATLTQMKDNPLWDFIVQMEDGHMLCLQFRHLGTAVFQAVSQANWGGIGIRFLMRDDIGIRSISQANRQAIAATGTRGSGDAPLWASAAAEGPPYTWDTIVGALKRTPFTGHCSVHDDALKYFRYIGESEPGFPYDMEGIDIPLEDDTVDIGTVTHDSEGLDFQVSRTPLQPWSWRAFLTQMKEPISGLVDFHGGVMSIRCVPFLNTVRATSATIAALTVWDFIVQMTDGYRVRLHARYRASGTLITMPDIKRATSKKVTFAASTDEGDHAPADARAVVHWTPLALTPWEAPPPPGLFSSGPAPSPASSSSAPAPPASSSPAPADAGRAPPSSSPAPADAGRLGALAQGRWPSRGDWAAAWWTRDDGWTWASAGAWGISRTSGGWSSGGWASGGWGGSSSSWQGWSEDT